MDSDWRRRAGRASAEAEILLRQLSAIIATCSKAMRTRAQKYLAQGEAPRDEKLDARELAAYATVASLILNLDETVTKE